MRVRLRPIALPAEHGGWGLLFEPIVLGMLLAPSWVGLFISVTATGLFLARHPFKLVVGDWRRQRRSARTGFALVFALLYFVIATLALAVAISTGRASFLLPLLFAAPIALVQLSCDSTDRSRSLIAELAGSIAAGSLATAIAISGGWPRPLAFVLWTIITARSVPTILYLRARLRRRRHKPASARLAIIAHVLAVLTIIILAWEGMAPRLAILAMAVLLTRAAIGLRSVKPIPPQKLGVTELIFGVVTVGMVFTGYALGW